MDHCKLYKKGVTHDQFSKMRRMLEKIEKVHPNVSDAGEMHPTFYTRSALRIINSWLKRHSSMVFGYELLFLMQISLEALHYSLRRQLRAKKMCLVDFKDSAEPMAVARLFEAEVG